MCLALYPVQYEFIAVNYDRGVWYSILIAIDEFLLHMQWTMADVRGTQWIMADVHGTQWTMADVRGTQFSIYEYMISCEFFM